MINMQWDVANNITGFLLGIIAIAGSIIGLVLRYAHLQARVATLEDRAERSERELSDYKKAMEIETKRIEGKLDSMQLGIGQVLRAVTSLETEVRIRFEDK